MSKSQLRFIVNVFVFLICQMFEITDSNFRLFEYYQSGNTVIINCQIILEKHKKYFRMLTIKYVTIREI